MPRPLSRRFFERSAAEVARDLLGAVLVRRIAAPNGPALLRARLVELEAYVGPHDLACHAAKGRTPRTEVMFGPGGHAYVYLIYGMHDMLNIVTGKTGDAQAVLVRAAEPLDGWTENLSGPGRLARAMHIGRGFNGIDMTRTEDGLWVQPGHRKSPPHAIGAAPRVGVDYAGPWAHQHLRFFETANPAVSKPWPWSKLSRRTPASG
ncbi:MAG TPA: DNA-3-methyladenine glycosylase [Phycisphaerae bacterium]|nr:DNA-3-methyladenine glycosylase [Phycisphaerae bacterium]